MGLRQDYINKTFYIRISNNATTRTNTLISNYTGSLPEDVRNRPIKKPKSLVRVAGSGFEGFGL